MSPETYVAYYRVSTVRQGQSGLGLDAQRSAAANFISAAGGVIVREFTDVESGKRADRPELTRAIAECRKSGATLLIAKLDRLARNVHFVSGLLESTVRFTAIDMPNADRFMLHVYAAMAEEEGRRISERTKAALASAKARGVELGKNGRALAKRHRALADTFAARVGPTIIRMKDEGLSYRAIAERLTEEGWAELRGGVCYATRSYRCITNGKIRGKAIQLRR